MPLVPKSAPPPKPSLDPMLNIPPVRPLFREWLIEHPRAYAEIFIPITNGAYIPDLFKAIHHDPELLNAYLLAAIEFLTVDGYLKRY